MIKIFRCSYCDFESQDEQETIEHEKTHVKIFECIKIQKKDEVPCTMNVLEKSDAEGDFYELTFVWDAVVTNKENPRTLSSVFVVNKDAMRKVFYEDKNE